MAVTFEFITTDPTANLKPGKSHQIRSRCMQGRNKQKGSRRSKREEKRLAEEAALAKNCEPEGNTTLIEFLLPPPAPSPLGGLDVVPFAGVEIDLEAKGHIFNAFRFDIMDQALAPLQACVDFSSTARETPSFEWLFQDAAFVHSVLCTSYAIADFRRLDWTGQPSSKTLFHLRETLKQLQARIQDRDAHMNEALMHAILNLVFLSAGWTDRDAALAHFAGLQKIVQLRGDLGFLSNRPKLHYKVNCLDLTWFLSTGKYTFFKYPLESWEPCYTQPVQHHDVGLYVPPAHWDPRLTGVFLDLQRLCGELNFSIGARIDAAHVQQKLRSIQSRLLHLRDALDGPVEELVRLIMLAFLTTLFRVPGQKIPYGWLSRFQLPDAFANVDAASFEMDETLGLWTVMVAVCSVSNVDADWVQELWRRCSALRLTWQTVKSQLIEVIWIESILDSPGKFAFERLQQMHAEP